MNCGVLGVGANNDPGEVPGELGEKEMKQLETQLQCVFDACDTTGSGLISLRQLANVSRSHVNGATQVEQILDIFDIGEDRAEDDQLDFSQFHSKVLAFLNSSGEDEKMVRHGNNSMKERRKSLSNSGSGPNSSNSNFGQRRKSLTNSSSSNMMGERRSSFSNISGHSPPSSTLSPPPAVQGVFNENLRRSFDKTTSSPIRSPGKKVLKSAGRRKTSQARLSGRIPLVNTSSEEEDCAELDDSFDRKIEASLEVARPLDLQPQYLVRGSVARATTKYPRSSSGVMGQQARRGSVAHSSLVDRRRPEVLTAGIPQSTRRSSTIDGMSPILNPNSHETFSPILPKAVPNANTGMYSMSVCSSSSPSSGRGSPTDQGRRSPSDNNSRKKMQEESTASARFVLDSLEHTVGQLANTAVVERRREEEYDSPSSGVGSLKAELEEEISSSLQLARRHGEERLMAERERWEREMAGVERERDMERRNSALRYQQLQEEKDQLKQEVERLQEKVRLVHLEKEQLNEQVAELIEEQRCRSPVTAVSTLLPVPVALTREVGTMAEAHVSSREVSTTMAETTMSTLREERSNREEELLQTVQALSMRVEVQDDQLAQVKEDNIVLRSQVRSLRETVGAKISPRPKGKEGKFRLFGMLGTGRGDPDEQSGSEEKYEDPADLRKMLAEVRAELLDQKEVNTQLKQYVGDVLVNIIAENPNILERQ